MKKLEKLLFEMSELSLWRSTCGAVTGCWNHLLLLPTLHYIFPLIAFVGLWWWTLGFVVHVPALLTPQPPSTHPSHFEQSHTSTNSHLPHTHCMHVMLDHTLTSGRCRAELDVETAGFTAEPAERRFRTVKFKLPRVAVVSFWAAGGKKRARNFLKLINKKVKMKYPWALSSPFHSLLSLSSFILPHTCPHWFYRFFLWTWNFILDLENTRLTKNLNTNKLFPSKWNVDL